MNHVWKQALAGMRLKQIDSPTQLPHESGSGYNVWTVLALRLADRRDPMAESGSWHIGRERYCRRHPEGPERQFVLHSHAGIMLAAHRVQHTLHSGNVPSAWQSEQPAQRVQVGEGADPETVLDNNALSTRRAVSGFSSVL